MIRKKTCELFFNDMTIESHAMTQNKTTDNLTDAAAAAAVATPLIKKTRSFTTHYVLKCARVWKTRGNKDKIKFVVFRELGCDVVSNSMNKGVHI